MKKRGQTIQFSWVFAIIAGAVILALFTGFAVKYKELQQERSEVEVLKNLDNILFSLQASSLQTTNELFIPINSDFNCNEIIVNDKSIKSDNLALSPTEFQGQSIIWYQPWKSPFRINNFYYIIPKDFKFYLVYNDATEKNVNYIIEKIPAALKNNFKKTGQPANAEGKSIYFTNAKNDFQIIPISDEKGKIIINNKEFTYDNFELLMAAIFSQDLVDYNCAREKALTSYGNIAFVYKQKALHLAGKNPQCSYNSIIALLSKPYDAEDSNILLNNNKFLLGQGCIEVF